MFGFGWVRIHLGVVFGDAFGVFEVFWLGFKNNGQNDKKSRQYRGSYAVA